MRSVQLGEIALFITRGKAPDYSPDGSGRIVKSAQVQPHCVLWGKCPAVSDAFVSKFAAKFGLRDGDVLLNGTGTGTLGRPGIVHSKPSGVFIPDSHVNLIRLDTTVADPGFVFHWLNSVSCQRQIALASSGSTNQIELSSERVSKLKLALPDLKEQMRVADTLDTADALRRKDQELLQKYDELAQSIFYEMFGDPVRNERGWEAATMGELCDNFKYGTNQKSEDIPAPGSVPVIRIPNVLKDVVNLNNLKYSIISDKELADVQLQHGDLLFVRTNGNPEYIGRCAVFTHNVTAGYASYLIRARLSKLARVLPQFVQSVLSTRPARNEFVKRATTTAGNYNINTQSIKSMPVIVPSLELQQSYLDAYQKVMQMKAVAAHNLICSEALLAQHLTTAFDN